MRISLRRYAPFYLCRSARKIEDFYRAVTGENIVSGSGRFIYFKLRLRTKKQKTGEEDHSFQVVHAYFIFYASELLQEICFGRTSLCVLFGATSNNLGEVPGTITATGDESPGCPTQPSTQQRRRQLRFSLIIERERGISTLQQSMNQPLSLNNYSPRSVCHGLPLAQPSQKRP